MQRCSRLVRHRSECRWGAARPGGGRSGPERVLALRCAGVEPLVLAGQVEAPVVVEVAVADDGAQGEDGFGAV
jgi:hypothetical protein